jgi:hypothetical protein
MDLLPHRQSGLNAGAAFFAGAAALAQAFLIKLPVCATHLILSSQ